MRVFYLNLQKQLIMNSIQIDVAIELYLDVTRNARYYRWERDKAVNDAIRNFMDNIIDDNINPKKQSGIQSEQIVSDNLFTLQKRQSAAPTADIALYPADYYTLLDINATINGVSKYCRPLNQNKLGPRLDNAFDPPSSDTPFYLQQATGYQIYYTGTLTNVDLDYYKTPVNFTIGTDSQLINPGVVLTLTLSYIATEVSVSAGVTYNVGDQFTATSTTLTSGQVILATNTTTIELPPKTHPEIAKIAASILSGVVSDFPKSQFAQVQADKS